MKVEPGEVMSYLRRINWPHNPRTDATVWLMCPHCKAPGGEKGEAFIHPDTGLGACRRENNCARRWNWYQFREATGDPMLHAMKRAGAASKSYRAPCAKPPEAPDVYQQEAREYMAARSVDPKFAADEFGVAVRMRHGIPAIVFPVWRDGKLLNRKYRLKSGSGSEPWKNFESETEAEQGLFGRDECDRETQNDGPLIVFEGEFDLICAAQLGFRNSVSVPSASNLGFIEAEWSWLQGFNVFYLCLDQDSAGEKCATEFARRLGADKCQRVKLPKKDLNDCVSELNWTAGDFISALNAAVDYKPAKLRSVSDFIEDALSMQRDDAVRGDSCPFPQLQGRLKGFRPGEMTYWAGDDGTGKTTIALNCAVHLAKKSIPVCIGSFELRPIRYVRWMADMMLEPGEHFDHATAKSSLERIAPSLWIVDHVGQISENDLIEVYKYAARRYGVRHCFTDSLMMLECDEDDYARQAAFVKRVKGELVDALQVHHHLVCHARKGQSDRTTGRDKASVKGTKVISSIHDNGILVVRNEGDSDGQDVPISTQLLLKKCREVPGQNLTVSLSFDQERRTFYEG